MAVLAYSVEDQLFNKIKLKILPLLIFSFIFAYIDRTNISFAYLRMKEDLLFGEAVYGFGAGIFFLGYVFFEVPSNMLLHKIGARIWISRIMLSWGIISAATLLVSSPTQFYIMRFLLGVAEAGFFPGVILYLTYWFPAKQIRNVTAIFIISIPASGLVGSFFSGLIIEIFSANTFMKSWQWLFLLEAIPSIVTGFVVYKCLPNGINDAKWLTDAEKKILTTARNAKNNENKSNGLIDIIKDSRIWIMVAMGGCFSVGMYGIIFWLPSIIKESGIIGNFKIGLLSSIPWLVSIIGMIVLSKIPPTVGKKHYFVVIPGILSAFGLVMSVIFYQNILLAIVFLSIAAMGIMCVFPGFWSLTSFLGGASAAAGIALINSMSNIFGFLSPAIIGHMVEITGSTSSSVFLMAGFIFSGSAIAYLFSTEEKTS